MDKVQKGQWDEHRYQVLMALMYREVVASQLIYNLSPEEDSLMKSSSSGK